MMCHANSVSRGIYTTEKFGSGPVKKAVRTHNFCKETLEFVQDHRRLWAPMAQQKLQHFFANVMGRTAFQDGSGRTEVSFLSSHSLKLCQKQDVPVQFQKRWMRVSSSIWQKLQRSLSLSFIFFFKKSLVASLLCNSLNWKTRSFEIFVHSKGSL